ncbi:MAG: shikimate kinase [Thermodesulfovibrionales bacterium]|nr:shikimate kinase [Thermodesulfovibrionales bacterium]
MKSFTMKNIALIGFMGTGKTTVGKLLAKRLGYKFIDLDREIEKKNNMTINEIFATKGELAFRDLETQTIKELSNRSMTVLSTGGGAVIRDENMMILKSFCLVVCLLASPDTVYNRTKDNKDRPLLKVDNPLDRIKSLLSERRPFYERADLAIKTDDKSPLQIVDEIMKIYERCK